MELNTIRKLGLANVRESKMLKLSNFLVLVFAIIVSWGTHSLADSFEILLSDDERSIIVKAGKEELEIGIGENCDVISLSLIHI